MPQEHLLLHLGGEKGRTCYQCFRQPEVFMAPQVHLGVWAATLGGFHLLSASTTFLSTWTWLSNILLHTDPIGSFFGFKSVPVEWLEPRCVPACKCADLIQFENWCNYPNIHGNRSAECNSCFFPLFFVSYKFRIHVISKSILHDLDGTTSILSFATEVASIKAYIWIRYQHPFRAYPNNWWFGILST